MGADGSFTMPLPPHVLTQIWEFDQNPGLKLGCKTYQCAVVEAPDPLGMDLTSASSIYKVFDNICCGWADRSITMLLPPHLLTQIWESSHNHPPGSSCWALNDTNVQWLRLQTHLGGFPHPPQAYTRCLTMFICCKWGQMDPAPCHYHRTC